MITEQCNREILELHEFFDEWFNARLPDTDEAFSRLEAVLSPEFVMITPGASRVNREQLLSDLRSMNGFYKQSGKPSAIWIENITTRQLSGSHCLATYREWQGNRDKTGGKGRISTALFQKDGTAPNNVRWCHLHETWIR